MLYDPIETLAKLAWLRRHPPKAKHPNLTSESPLAIDAIRGTLFEQKWRGTVSEYFSQNPDTWDSVLDSAIDRIKRMELDADSVQPGSNPFPESVTIGFGTYGWKYDVSILMRKNVGYVDTAESYGYGRAEGALGKGFATSLRPIISSKVSRNHMSHMAVLNAGLRSKERLNVGSIGIDLYFLHWPNPKNDYNDSLSAMSELKECGHIRSIGVSNLSTDMLLSAMQYADISAIQVRYSLWDRSIERLLLPVCQDLGLPIVAYSPLGQDFKKSQKHPGYTVLEEVSKSAGCTPAQAALSWICDVDGVIPIPRTNDPKHASEISEVPTLRLSYQEMSMLDEAFPILE